MHANSHTRPRLQLEGRTGPSSPSYPLTSSDSLGSLYWKLAPVRITGSEVSPPARSPEPYFIFHIVSPSIGSDCSPYGRTAGSFGTESLGRSLDGPRRATEEEPHRERGGSRKQQQELQGRRWLPLGPQPLHWRTNPHRNRPTHCFPLPKQKSRGSVFFKHTKPWKVCAQGWPVRKTFAYSNQHHPKSRELSGSCLLSLFYC